LLQELSTEEKAALELKVDALDRTKSGSVLVSTYDNPLDDDPIQTFEPETR
jgi:hypothetical protein